MTPRRLVALVVVAALVMVASASTADTLTLTLVSQNNTTITLGWTPQPGYGYLFSADGVLQSRTNDASRSTVKFSKSFATYEVAVIVKGATGTYPTAPPPPPPPAAQCADGIDNDGDGKVDLADPGCSNSADTDETDPSPPPPASTMTGAQFESACNMSGATIGNVTVSASGTLSCGASNVTVRNSKLSGVVLDIDPGAGGFRLENTDIENGGFNIWGADNVTIVDGAFDGGGRVSSNQMWDTPAKNGSVHVVIARNSFSNYRGGDCSVHGEGLFIGGYANDVLVEGNTFSNNGCTSHIFFSFFGFDGLNGYNSAQVPRNVCVRGNTFGPRFAQTFFDVNFRSEVAQVGPAVTNIKVQPGSATTNPEFNAVC